VSASPHSFVRRRLACAAVLAALFSAAGARAYCPEVTEDAPANYDPATQGGCFTVDPATGVTLPTLYWKNQRIGYSLQRDASDQISLSVATSVAAQAFGTWANAACSNGPPSIQAVWLPPVDCDVVPSKGYGNVIIFRDAAWPYPGDSTNALGITRLTVNKTTGEIYGADIEINSTKLIVAQSPAPAGGYDLASILTHEAGHFLGLAHSASPSAVMYAFYKAGSTSLSADDVGGICSIYSPDGTRNTSGGPVQGGSFDSTPRYGYSDTCDAPDGGDAGGVSYVPFEGGTADPNAGPCEVGLFQCALAPAPSRTSAPAGPLACLAIASAWLARRTIRRRRG
jgi:hypothetical protein